MKFSKTFTNKLVSYADRYFTWDSRKMKRENIGEMFDFFAISRDNGITTCVCIDRSSQHGIWTSIQRGNTYIHHGFLKTYADVNAFKKMIKCLG